MTFDGRFFTKTLREQVFQYLKTEMKEGNLRPGEIINIRKLSLELGVSRTTLKDALLGLQAEGFVVFIPHKGVKIPEITPEELRDNYQIVGALEASVLLLFEGTISKTFLDKLRKYNDLIDLAIKNRESSRYWHYNFEFHNTILSLSTNRKLISIVHNIRARVYEFPALKNFNWSWGEKCLREHSTIISLLEKGEKREAAIYLETKHWSFKEQWPYIKHTYFQKEQKDI
jgi:DNA-binding GntR family transcriptional regulator